MTALELGIKVGKGSNQTAQKSRYSKLLQHTEMPTHAKVLTFVPLSYMDLLDGLYEVEGARFKDCFKKGEILLLVFDSIGKLK